MTKPLSSEKRGCRECGRVDRHFVGCSLNLIRQSRTPVLDSERSPERHDDGCWIACADRLPSEDIEGKDCDGDTVSVRCQIRDGEGRSEFARLHYPTDEWCWRSEKGEWEPRDWRVTKNDGPAPDKGEVASGDKDQIAMWLRDLNDAGWHRNSVSVFQDPEGRFVAWALRGMV